MPSKRNDSEIINSGGGGGGFSNPMTATGDLIKGGIAGTPSRLPSGTTGQVLSIVAGIPTWSTVVGTQGLTGATGAQGAPGVNGTNGTSFTNVMTALGDIIVGGAAGIATRLPKGSEGYRLSIVSGSPAWVAPAAGANGFVDTFIDVSNISGVQTLPASAFTLIDLQVVNSDVSGNYNTLGSYYTVPSSGIYQITGTFRAADQSPASTNFGVGVNGAIADGTWFLWHSVQATPNVEHRTTYPYTRVAYFAAGTQLKMFAFAQASIGVGNVGMQIIRIA